MIAHPMACAWVAFCVTFTATYTFLQGVLG